MTKFDSVEMLDYSDREMMTISGGGLEDNATTAALKYLGGRLGGALLRGVVGGVGTAVDVFGDPAPLSNGEVTPNSQPTRVDVGGIVDTFGGGYNGRL